ncbi:MAG: transcriptional repressor [Actinobacteria bacterium]|nr:transcriptional repressor [Actinomycetota bacterium]
MTVAHLTPPLATGDVEEAVAALRDRGLRASAARRVVLEALFFADRPLRAEEIAEGVPGRVPRSDLTSVYRNLETLEKVGLIRHLHVGHQAGLYALSGTEEREYLTCESCGSIRVVCTAVLGVVRALIREHEDFVASFRHFPIAGLCSVCAVAAPSVGEEGQRHV